MSVMVVSAADDAYSWMLLDLVRSLRAAEVPDFKIGCLDLGLGDATRETLSDLVDHIVKPGWPFKPHAVFDARPSYLARAVRPFLPTYFPGFETYIWLDADCWVQQGEALKQLALAASRGAIAVVPAVDRSYFQTPTARKWLFQRYRMAFDDDEAKHLMSFNYINSGVFALKGGAKHWRAWQQRFQNSLDHWRGDFLSDQAVLNALIHIDKQRAILLPAEYNWVCTLALPMWAPKLKRLVNPNFPWTQLGIVHNSFVDKRRVVHLRSTTGQKVATELSYSAYLALGER